MTTTQRLTLPPTASQARSLNCRKSGSAAALTAVLLWAISVRIVSAAGSPAAAEAPTRCGTKVSGSSVAHPGRPHGGCVSCASPSCQSLRPAAALLLRSATGASPLSGAGSGSLVPHAGGRGGAGARHGTERRKYK